jgi:hypothetical protein
VLGGDNRMLSILIHFTICSPMLGMYAPDGAAHIAMAEDR